MSMTSVRPANADDAPAVIAILDAAMLAFDRSGIDDRIRQDDVFVAERAGEVVGALVLEGERVTAIAVRPYARDEGRGRALIEAALSDRGRLTAGCDAQQRPFYEAVGFELEQRPDGRWEGVLEAS